MPAISSKGRGGGGGGGGEGDIVGDDVGDEDGAVPVLPGQLRRSTSSLPIELGQDVENESSHLI